MNEQESEEFIIEETIYKITPEGSSFLNCTPSILGPQYDRILSLNFAQMRLLGIEVVYHWISWEGLNVPNLILKFSSSGAKETILFRIQCILYILWGDLSRFETKSIPDLNSFTPFSEKESSMEVNLYSNYNHHYQNGEQMSTITLQDQYGHRIDIDCFKLQFLFED